MTTEAAPAADGEQRPGAAAGIPPGMHRFTQMERVIHGRPVADALAGELELLGARRVFLVTNRSLADGDAVAHIVAALGDRLAGRFDGVRAHAPRDCIVEGAAAIRSAGADLLLAVGGGSVIDAAKVMSLCVRHGYGRIEQLDPHANRRAPDTGHAPADAAHWLRVLAVPTTLSGAEFASSGGATDPRSRMKEAFVEPMLMPVSVILDPAMTFATPLPLMLATGIKAIDHAVERVTSANANPYSDAVSLLALRLLAQALPAIRLRPDDPGPRNDAQYGMFMSLAGSASGVAVNGSHAIGHVLGAHAAVPHGETSCVLCPAVLRWHADVAADRHRLLCDALDVPGHDAAGALSSLIASLGLPQRLRDVGVQRDQFDDIARKTMHEALLRNSRKPVRSEADVLEILEIAW